MISNQWRARGVLHYNEATRLLTDVWADSAETMSTAAVANVHATLSVAAFTALLFGADGGEVSS